MNGRQAESGPSAASGREKDDFVPASTRDLFPATYMELRAIARTYLANSRGDLTLQPTALVHEAFLRLSSGSSQAKWDSEGGFILAVSKAMRHALIDHLRSRNRIKRGGHAVRQPFIEMTADTQVSALDPEVLLALDDALCRLEREGGSRAVDVTTMRFFAGLTFEQIAAALGLASRTVKRDWRFARAWLYEALEQVHDHEQS